MSRLHGRSQNRESQESCPEGPGAACPCQHFGAAKARPRLIGLLLALVTLLVYLPVTRHGFLNYDDNDYVTENPAVQNGLGWAAIQWAFTTQHAGNWHPLTWLSHTNDCSLFGLNAGAHHVVNVLFHAANAALLFGLLLRLTGALWPAAFVAALFAWHPLHVESVAWIAERKDVLSTFFALLTLLAYTRYAQKHGAGDKDRADNGTTRENKIQNPASLFYWLALGFFALGLMAKPMLVTLPFVMLLLDYWPLGRIAECGVRSANLRNATRPSTLNPQLSTLLVEKWPFFLLTAVSCGVTVITQRNAEGIIPLEDFPAVSRLENVPTAYARYLLKTIWPANLAVIYPLSPNISSLALVTSLAILISLSVAAGLACKRSPYFPVGWLWFLGTLVPVIGLVQVGIAALADRYTYFPLVGVFIAVAFAARDLANRFSVPKPAVATAAFLALAACLVLTERQLRYWHDSESLFRHALAVTKDNGMAHLNLGTVFQETGRLNEALAEYRAAARRLPGYFHVHNNLGSVLDDLGRPEEALAEYRLTLQLRPNLPAVHEGIGIVYAELGRFAEAMNEFTNAAQLDPAYSWPYFQMGQVLLKQGRDPEAMEKFRAALRIDPDNFQILAHVARVLAADENPAVRDGQTALAYAVKANILSDGSRSFVLDALGMACAEAGHFDDARKAAEKAIALAAAAGRQSDVASMQQRLEFYRNLQPWRESFAATNTPPKELPKP
jgi:protein O-mannosyl-transferase